MKTTILLLATILFSSCSLDDKNCYSELQELETLREKGWTNCNGSNACVLKIESDYQRKRNEILKDCK
jgi:hypothetical protein